MGVTTSVERGGVIYYESWVHSAPYAALPPFAVIGGHDCDGSPIYVGRSYHEGDQLPAKVIPSKGSAYVAWGGQEHVKSHYEVLVGNCYAWVPCYNGAVPPNAVRSGNTRTGEPLYVGRGHHANSLTVGKIHPSHGCLYIPFGGQEVRINTYEVLVKQAHDNWVASTPNYTPPGAVVAGHDTDRAVIYVGRAMHEGELLPAKIIPSKGCAYVCYGGYEINKHNFEVLCGHGYAWVKTHHHQIPPNAVQTGRSRNGQPLYVGRGHHHGSLTPGLVSVAQRCVFIPYGGREIRIDSYEVLIHYKWLHSSAYSKIPDNAIVGGTDVDGSVMYVGRSYHNGDNLVAKVLPSKHCAFVCWQGAEISKDHFEVLCGTGLVWRQCYDRRIPDNAVLCGKTKLGQNIYIGRGHYEGSLTVGKISSVHRSLFIPFKGAERRLDSFEILVEERKQIDWDLPTPPPPMSLDEKPVNYPMLDTKQPMPMPMPMPIPTPQPLPLPTTTPQPPAIGLLPPPYPMPQPDDPPPPYNPTYEASGMYPSYPAPYVPSRLPSATTSLDMWVGAGPLYTPRDGVHAGHDTDLSPLYVCRAFHDGEMIPGKAVPNRGYAHISNAGQEFIKQDYEMLCGHGYEWVPAFDGNIPPGAVEAGRTAYTETLYVGRSHYSGSLTPGKVQPSHRCLYIPFGGREIRLSNYEVLVRSEHYHRYQSVKLSYY